MEMLWATVAKAICKKMRQKNAENC